MRVAIFHNLSSGGAKRTLHEQAKRLAARHTVDVYTLASADHGFADVRPYVERHQVYDFDPGRLLPSPFGRLNQLVRMSDLKRLDALNRRIAADIAAVHYDAVLVHPCRFENAPSLLRHLMSPRSIYYCHEPLRRLYETVPARPYDDNASARRTILNAVDPLPRLYVSRLQRTDRQSTQAAARVLANSQFVCDAVSRIYRVAAHVSYHGVDTERFVPLGLVRERFVFSAGSLTPLKGFDFLIQALSLIPRGTRPPLVIASNFQNPPERAYLLQLARDQGVDLQLLVDIDDRQLVDLYNRCYLTAYAPHREPFGLVPLEAMACATPVVAVREGGIHETVQHEQSGLLVNRDPAAFAAAIQRLLSDRDLAAELGQGGLEQALGRWTWERAVRLLEEHLVAIASCRFSRGALLSGSQ